MKEKDQIENLFRRSFENHEFDYDPKQWDKLKKRLDNSSNSIHKKWILGTFILLLLSSAAIYLYNESRNVIEETPTKKLNASNLQEKGNKNSNPKLVLSDSSKTKLNDNNNLDQSKNNRLNSSQMDVIEVKNNHTKEQTNLLDSNNFSNNSNHGINLKDSLEKEVLISHEENENSGMLLGNSLPMITKKCKNDEITIDNKNGDNLYIITPNNEKYVIKPSESKVIKLSSAGSYSILTEDREINLSKTFEVYENPELFLNHDAYLNFQDGLPVLNCQVTCSENQTNWKLNNSVVYLSQENKNVDLNIFKKGIHDIIVETKNEFGCVSKVNSSISIEEDYNLLAVNAFSPNSSDVRNQTFMPYGLIKRGTPFKLSIYDPDDGGLIFETEDANLPWEGIDKRTGVIIPLNKAYIWRVNLLKPLFGENPMYQGTIVRF